MISLGYLIDNLTDQLNDPRDDVNTSWTNIVRRMINQAYLFVASERPWSIFTRTKTLDSTYRLPADMDRIQEVYDDNDDFYTFVEDKQRGSMYDHNWYWDTPILTALASGVTAKVKDHATAITSDAEFPATTCAGEFIIFGKNAGIYEISTWTSTSAIALVQGYRGDDASAGVSFEIRPVGTKVIGLCDNDGDVLTPDSVYVTYTIRPLPVFTDTDQILFPGDCGAVRIKALQYLLAHKRYDRAADRKENEYRRELAKMKEGEPEEATMSPTSLFQERSIRRRINDNSVWVTGR